MGYIVKNGINYFGDNSVSLTQAQYDALVQAGTVDPATTYFITDGTPSTSSDYIKVKMVNPLATDITRNMDMSSYIQLDTGYKFLTWLTNIVPQGFTTDTYLWLADPNLPVGHPYWHTNPIPNSGTAGRLRFFYLEIKNV